MNKLRAKIIFRSLPAVRKSISEEKSQFCFFGHPPSMLHENKFFSISHRRLSIFIAFAARMNSKCQLSAHKIGFLFLCLFSSFPVEIYWIFLSLNLSLFHVSRNLKIFISAEFFFRVQFSNIIFCAITFDSNSI